MRSRVPNLEHKRENPSAGEFALVRQGVSELSDDHGDAAGDSLLHGGNGAELRERERERDEIVSSFVVVTGWAQLHDRSNHQRDRWVAKVIDESWIAVEIEFSFALRNE